MLLLLMLSFGVWGIGDYVVGGGAYDTAVTIGETELSAEQIRLEFEQDLSVLRQNGMDFSTQEALSMGLLSRTLTRLTEAAALDETARSLGLMVTDDHLAASIRTDPLFMNDTGQFDRGQYRAMLAANRLSEAGYEAQRRLQTIRRTIVEPVFGAIEAPSVVADLQASYQAELRSGQLLTVSAAALPPPAAEPSDEAELQAVYDAQIDAFTEPEFRSLSVITLTPALVADSVLVPEEDLQALYDSRIDDLRIPANRDVSQALFADQATAQAAYDQIQSSAATLQDAADAAGASAVVDMGPVTPEDLPGGLADSVFAQEIGVVGAPVESPLGWHLFLVNSAQAETVPPLDEVRESLTEELSAELSQDALYNLSADLDDAMAAGNSLEEAANSLGLTLIRVPALSITGNTPEGSPAPALAEVSDRIEIINRGFTLAEGEEDLLQETETGFFLVRVDSITPPSAKPLAEVRDQVITLWRADQRSNAALNKAEALADQVIGLGETMTFDAMASEEPAVTLTAIPTVTRLGTLGPGAAEETVVPERPVFEALFALSSRGDSQAISLPNGDAALVVLQEIQPASDDNPMAVAVTQQLSEAYSATIGSAWVESLRNAAGVNYNQAALNAAFSQDGPTH